MAVLRSGVLHLYILLKVLDSESDSQIFVANTHTWLYNSRWIGLQLYGALCYIGEDLMMIHSRYYYVDV